MFSFVGTLLDGQIVGGTAESFTLTDVDGKQGLSLLVLSRGDTVRKLYVSGRWTLRTYGAVALEIDLDATNESR